ncbi:MAG: hypothetical protein LBQ78_03580 [Tannerellaceae bacterium]|jgi:hypothetical protein|nr:hypothetical protein [Tannerellaceae bacterium]
MQYYVAFVHHFAVFADKVNFLNPLFSAIEPTSSSGGAIQTVFRGVKISFCYFANICKNER